MIEWLSTDQVAQINAYQVATFGGFQGTRDAGALESAVFPPQNAHAYTGSGLFECAALYAERISRSRDFLDSSKRTGLQAALLFLAANGQHVPPDPDFEDLMMALTVEKLDVATFAANFESRSGPLGPVCIQRIGNHRFHRFHRFIMCELRGWNSGGPAMDSRSV